MRHSVLYVRRHRIARIPEARNCSSSTHPFRFRSVVFHWVCSSEEKTIYKNFYSKFVIFFIIFRRMTGSRINGARSHSNLFTNPSDNSSNSTSPDQSPTNSPSHSILIDPYRRSSHEPLSFESICNDQNRSSECNQINEPGCDVGSLSESNLKKMQPLLWLELASLFDKHHINLDKRKPFKRKRKEEGNLFGVSLNALVRRDQQVTGEDSSLVPMLLQDILKELTMRGAREEGILRIPGNKQRTEFLYVELEKNFYLRYESVNELLAKAGVHDLSTLLKRWLRELPMPLLATELVHLFYQSHGKDCFSSCVCVCVMHRKS